LAGFEKLKAELDAVGAKVFAASIDPIDKAAEVVAELSFPVGYGVTRAIAEQLDSWWEERRSVVAIFDHSPVDKHLTISRGF
jgi:peroxiredoxin